MAKAGKLAGKAVVIEPVRVENVALTIGADRYPAGKAGGIERGGQRVVTSKCCVRRIDGLHVGHRIEQRVGIAVDRQSGARACPTGEGYTAGIGDRTAGSALVGQEIELACPADRHRRGDGDRMVGVERQRRSA